MQQNYNKKNKGLALLGQGKWKHALRSALVLMGFMLGLGGMNVWAQEEELPDGLKLDKQFFPNQGSNGRSGTIVLETYVTGTIQHVTASQPTDIVLVLDASSSMNNTQTANMMSYTNSNNQTFYIKRMTALQIAVREFIDKIYEDSQNSHFGGEGNENYDHRIAVLSFNNNTSAHLLSTASPTDNVNATTCYDALVPVQQYYNTRLGTALTGTGQENLSPGNINAMNNGAIYGSWGYGTYMHQGLNAARSILNNRATNGRGVSFTAPGTTVELPRNMVVVFFTDGYPGANGMSGNWPNTSGDADLVPNANNAVSSASGIKQITVQYGGQTVRPTIYSIAVNADAAPTANYKVTLRNNSYRTGAQCFNALLHFISSEYGSELTNWVTPAQNATYGASSSGSDYPERQKYFAAENVEQLTGIFQQISSASGATDYELDATAIVQDIISPSFTLPNHTEDINTIRVYAPKYIGVSEEHPTGFEDTLSATVSGVPFAGRMVLDYDPESDTYGRLTDSTYENRISSQGIISIEGRKINLQNFDFSHYYVAEDEDPVTHAVTYRGRKLVISFPIEVEEGIWGDGLYTNTELSFVTPNGVEEFHFPMPQTDVVADVWTEVVVQQPSTFDPTKNPIPLYTPEDLAWFISWVNGRLSYEEPYNTTVAHPGANAILMADIDMSAHNWVSIGDEIGGYTGTFDGNGYVITGLKNNASKYYKLNNHALVYPGMFSNVKGTVKNVFVLDSDFHAKNHVLQEGDEFKTFIHFGIIADTLSSGGQIFNCEAAGRITSNTKTDNLDRDSQMIFGGLVGFNNGGTIHSSMAMPTLTGYSMGGLAGENGGTVANSFTNGVYNYLGTADLEDPENDPDMLFRYVGGLVGRNHHKTVDVNNNASFSFGTVNNCYVRFERQDNLGGDVKFGQFVGSNKANNTSGTVTNCYYPWNNNFDLVADDPGNGYGKTTNYYTTPTAPSLMRYERSNDNMVGGTYSTKTYTINGQPTDVDVWQNGTTLVDKLNANRGNYTPWKRTTAGNYVSSQNGGNINGDYPVLKIAGFTCLASTDGLTIDYAVSLDHMLERHNTGVMNVNTQLPGANSGYVPADPQHPSTHNYHVSQNEVDINNKPQSDFIYGGTINLYANDNTSKGTSTTAKTMVYIDENISLLQSTSAEIDAYTGQYIIDYGATSDPQSGNRWHNVSSSLQNSMFGWTYQISEQVPHHMGNRWDSYKSTWDANNPSDVLTADDPCKIWLHQADEDHELFPSDMASSHPMDFYCFDEPSYHWINFKRNTNSHWHMDDPNLQIPYTNEDRFKPGKGYLLALHTEYFQWGNENMHLWTESESAKKDRTFLQNRGTLNNGDVNIPVTYTAANEWTGLAGYNFLGNPYQSFLDFDKFVSGNTGCGQVVSSKRLALSMILKQIPISKSQQQLLLKVPRLQDRPLICTRASSSRWVKMARHTSPTPCVPMKPRPTSVVLVRPTR